MCGAMLSSALCVVRCAQHGVRLVAGALLSSSVPCWWSRGEDVLHTAPVLTPYIHYTPHHNNNCWQLQLPASCVLQPRNHWKQATLCSVFCYPLELVLVPTAPLSSIMMTYFRYTHYRWVKAVPVCCAGLGRGPWCVFNSLDAAAVSSQEQEDVMPAESFQPPQERSEIKQRNYSFHQKVERKQASSSKLSGLGFLLLALLIC